MMPSSNKDHNAPEIMISPAVQIIDGEVNDREFLVCTLEDEEEWRVPFIADYDTSCNANTFKRLIALEHVRYNFFVITIENPKSDFTISNKNGYLKVVFDTHTFDVNKNKIVEQSDLYQDGVDKVISRVYDYDKLPNRPKYYNPRITTLVPGNFKIIRDTLYVQSDQSGLDFKGVFSLLDLEPRMPLVKTGDIFEFFTITRCYAVFQGTERVYAIPIPRGMKCYVDQNTDIIRLTDSSDEVSYEVSSGTLTVGEMKIVTINVFRYRVIIASSMDEALNLGLSRLRGLSFDDIWSGHGH